MKFSDPNNTDTTDSNGNESDTEPSVNVPWSDTPVPVSDAIDHLATMEAEQSGKLAESITELRSELNELREQFKARGPDCCETPNVRPLKPGTTFTTSAGQTATAERGDRLCENCKTVISADGEYYR